MLRDSEIKKPIFSYVIGSNLHFKFISDLGNLTLFLIGGSFLHGCVNFKTMSSIKLLLELAFKEILVKWILWSLGRVVLYKITRFVEVLKLI